MKIIISMLVCCFVFAGVQAQKITRDYNNVSLSEALRQLNEQTEEYTISFLYNELEDFRITTSVHRKTVPDAIRQMIGFYPIRMTVDDKEIIVECPQKTALRYKGTIIDTDGQPVAYANIALLSPQPALAAGLHADYWRRVERKRFLRHSLRAAARPRTCLIRGLQDDLQTM